MVLLKATSQSSSLKYELSILEDPLEVIHTESQSSLLFPLT